MAIDSMQIGMIVASVVLVVSVVVAIFAIGVIKQSQYQHSKELEESPKVRESQLQHFTTRLSPRNCYNDNAKESLSASMQAQDGNSARTPANPQTAAQLMTLSDAQTRRPNASFRDDVVSTRSEESSTAFTSGVVACVQVSDSSSSESGSVKSSLESKK